MQVPGIELRLLSFWCTFPHSADSLFPPFWGEKKHKTATTATSKKHFNPVRLPHFSERSEQDVADLLVCAACPGGLEVGTARRDGKWDRQGPSEAQQIALLLYVVQHGLGPQMCTTSLALPVGRFE